MNTQPIYAKRCLLLLSSIALAGACSRVPAPNQEIAEARQAIESANTTGAGEFAPSEMARATEKLGEAEDAMDGRRYREAKRLGEQAQVDAEYAQARTAAIRAERALADTKSAATLP